MNFELVIAEILMHHSLIINARIEARWGTMVGIEGEAHAGIPLVVLPVASVISDTLTYWGQKTWIAEFGSGSEMDLTNPYLEDYKANPNYNPARLEDGSITGRPEGEYFDLDGNPQYSTGHAEGKNLELKPVYTVVLPMHVIRDEITDEMPDIEADIQISVKEFLVEKLRMNVQIYL